MMKPLLTLNDVRKSPKLATERVSTVSDYLTADEVEKLHQLAQNSKKQLKFDKVDALCAEIAARFGWEVYEKWSSGVISDEKIAHFINAERARERETLADLESVVYASVSACVKRYKGEKKPRSLKVAAKILKRNIDIAKGY